MESLSEKYERFAAMADSVDAQEPTTGGAEGLQSAEDVVLGGRPADSHHSKTILTLSDWQKRHISKSQQRKGAVWQLLVRALMGWQVSPVARGSRPLPVRPHALLLCRLSPEKEIRTLTMYWGRPSAGDVIAGAIAILGGPKLRDRLRDNPQLNAGSAVPPDQACVNLGYRPQQLYFEDPELASAAAPVLRQVGVPCGVLEPSPDAARFVGQISARMLAQGHARASGHSTMPGVLSRAGVASSDAVPEALAIELWRAASLLRALRCNDRIHWHRLAFRVALEEEIRVPGTGGLCVRPCVMWVHLDETQGHRTVIERSKAAGSGAGAGGGRAEESGSESLSLLAAPSAKPVVLAPGPEEPTLYVMGSRHEAEQMLMASADPTEGASSGLAQAVPHVLDQVCGHCGKTTWEVGQEGGEEGAGETAVAVERDDDPTPKPTEQTIKAPAEPLPSMGRCTKCKAVYYCSRDCQSQDYPAHKKTCKTARTRKVGEPMRPAEALLVSFQLAPSLPFEDLDAIEGLGLQPWRVRRVSRARAVAESSSGGEEGAGEAAGAGAGAASGGGGGSRNGLEELLGYPMLAKMQGSSGRARLTARDCVRLLLCTRALVHVLLCDPWLMRPRQPVSRQPAAKVMVLGSGAEADRLQRATGDGSEDADGGPVGGKGEAGAASGAGAGGGDAASAGKERGRREDSMRRWVSPSEWDPRPPCSLVRQWPDWLQARVSVCGDFMLTRSEREEVSAAVQRQQEKEEEDEATRQSPEERARARVDAQVREVDSCADGGTGHSGSGGEDGERSGGLGEDDGWLGALWKGLKCCCGCGCCSIRRRAPAPAAAAGRGGESKKDA